MYCYTDTLLFIHMQKTGGSFVRNVMYATFNNCKQGKSHRPLWCVPDRDRRNRLSFGCIRNPYAWHVSMWNEFSRKMPFAEYVRETCSNCRAAARGYPATKVAWTGGAWSYMVHNYFANHRSRVGHHLDVNALVRLERIEDGLQEVWGRPIVVPDRAIVTRRERGVRRAKPHPPYRDMYSEGLRVLVADKEGPWLERFGYTFDGPTDKDSVLWLNR